MGIVRRHRSVRIAGAILAGLLALVLAFGSASAYPKRVERLLDKGDVRKALELLDKAAQRNPGDPEAWLDLALVHRNFRAVEDPRKELHYLRKAERAASSGGEQELVAGTIAPRIAELEPKVDRLDWEAAQERRTAEAGQQYKVLHPDGAFVVDAEHMIQDLHAEEALSRRTVVAYRHFLESAEGHVYYRRGEVVDELHKLAWLDASSRATANGFIDFIRDYPENANSGDAYARLFREVTGPGTEEAYLEYLRVAPDKSWTSAREHRSRAWGGLLDLVPRRDRAALEGWLQRFPQAPNRDDAYGRLLETVAPDDDRGLETYLARHPDATNRRDAHAALFAVRAAQGARALETYLGAYEDIPDRSAVERAHYEAFVADGRESSLAGYADQWPSRTHAADAEQAIWSGFYDTGDLASMKAYVKAYPSSTHAQTAQTAVYRLAFAAAKASGRVDQLVTFQQKYPAAPQNSQVDSAVFGILKEQLDVELQTSNSYSTVHRSGYDYTTVDKDWDGEVTGTTRHQSSGYNETVVSGTYITLNVKNRSRYPLVVDVWTGHLEKHSSWGSTRTTGDQKDFRAVVAPGRGKAVEGYLDDVKGYEAEWEIKKIRVLGSDEYALFARCEKYQKIPDLDRFIRTYPNSSVVGEIRNGLNQRLRSLVSVDAEAHREKGNRGYKATVKNKSSSYTLEMSVGGSTFTLRPGASRQLGLVSDWPSVSWVKLVR